MSNDEFQDLVWQKGRELYRDMPWRNTDNPYLVMVSELMLQQTQVDRVIPKYNEFILRYPDVYSLATAPLADILGIWNGLGYNRRAKFLHDSAVKIVSDFDGKVPSTVESLMSLPGIGPNTAAAIAAYAFNQPVGFIETNIRTVYFQHFFADSHLVTDDELRRVVFETIPVFEKGKEQPDGRIDPDPGAMRKTVGLSHVRYWFWALMDYGAYLKKQGSGRIDKSAHYKKQSPLKGSAREVRGQIIRVLTKGTMTQAELIDEIIADDRYQPALAALIKEGLVIQTGDKLHLTK